MNRHTKIAIIAVAVVIAVGLTAALVLTARARRARVVTDVRAELRVDTVSQLTAPAVISFMKARKLIPTGQRCDSVDLTHIEDEVATMPLVGTVECYFDNRGVLRVVVTERLPLFHVHTIVSDYCVDFNGRQMATPAMIRPGVPRVSGDVTLDFATGDLYRLILYIHNDPDFADDFLHFSVGRGNQVSTYSVSGSYRVRLGRPDRYEQRLDKLRRFRLWQQKTGHDGLYSEISLQYRDQIVCKKKQE